MSLVFLCVCLSVSPVCCFSCHWLLCCCVVSRDDARGCPTYALSLQRCCYSHLQVYAGTICFLFPCCKRSASPSTSPPRVSPPALITYHLGHTRSSISSKPAFAQHAPVATARWADTQQRRGLDGLHGLQRPNRQRHAPIDVSSLHLWMLVQGLVELVLLVVDEAWLCGSATHGPLPVCIVLGSTSDYLIAASHNHEEASSPRLFDAQL